LLRHLQIRDFAVIEELEVQFDDGMTVFTGETGAGKSIIVDALGLVLGDRADSSIIRSHCDSTEITAIFEINNYQSIKDTLEEQGIKFEEELILRRVINRDGRSRAYINSTPVPAQQLRELGESMVDIHGQHAHQSLLKRDIQRQLLDEFGQHNETVQQIIDHYLEWQTTNAELARLIGHDEDRDARLALLQYQVQELEALNPVPAEIAALEDEHTRLANINRLLESCQQALNQLTDDEHAILRQLNIVQHELRGVVRFDQKLTSVTDMLESAGIQINEAGSELMHYLDTLDQDPDRMHTVEERIDTLHDIARKHKVKPEELAVQLQKLRSDLKDLEDSEQRLADLEKAREIALEKYWNTADKLHALRTTAAKKLGTTIKDKLKELGMPGSRFQIEIQQIEKNTPQRYGMDKIEYLVAINPGQPMYPLNKVASGGELSRISLAIQVIASKDKALPTLIFDEVDAGIGGAVAEIVGNLLHSLAVNRQVFCVTHLPQVAALGDNHLLVNKSTHAETTLTQIVALNREERIEEIARMLGGLKITEQSLAHAREMLAGGR
jgi:DNA repair protein RecN (Recombination protein N)